MIRTENSLIILGTKKGGGSPQSAAESNLAMIALLRKRYAVPVGYSGHEIGFLPTLASVALGADLVERHITPDKNLVGFDHKLSLEPHELLQMVRDIRTIERTVGTTKKIVTEREMVTLKKYRVSIVTAKDVQPGQTITESMLTLKNPGTGLPPSHIKKVIGKKAKVRALADTLLDLEMVEGDEDIKRGSK